MNQYGGQPTQSPAIATMLRANQIIVFSFIFGVLSFAVVVIFLRSSGNSSPSDGLPVNLLLAILGALLLSAVVVGAVIRTAMVGGLRRKSDRGETIHDAVLLQKFGMLTIMRAALAEGAALFGVVLTLISSSWFGLAGAAVAIVLLALAIPTRGKFDAFVRDATGQMR